MKIQTLKFIRNIIIGIVALGIVAIIVNISPGYKRNKYSDVINLVIEDENVTEELKNPILKNAEGAIYISIDDTKLISDKEIDKNVEILKKDDVVYIEEKGIKAVYNVEINYIESSNIVVIDKLDEEHGEAKVNEEAEIRYKQRSLSKIVGNLKVGDTVTTFYTTRKGWTKIRTEDGTVGYVRAEKLTKVEEIIK